MRRSTILLKIPSIPTLLDKLVFFFRTIMEDTIMWLNILKRAILFWESHILYYKIRTLINAASAVRNMSACRTQQDILGSHAVSTKMAVSCVSCRVFTNVSEIRAASIMKAMGDYMTCMNAWLLITPTDFCISRRYRLNIFRILYQLCSL